MSRLLLIRHAATDAVGRYLAGRAAGVHLNARGREQAAQLVDRLRDAPLDLICVSPLERARETAEPLAAARDLPIIELPELQELDYGDWQGMAPAALADNVYWATYNRRRSLCRIPGGETLIEAQVRMVRAVEWLRAEYPGQSVALIGHGDPLKALLAHLTGIPLDFITRLEITPAAVTAVQFDDDGCPHILCVNAEGAPA